MIKKHNHKFIYYSSKNYTCHTPWFYSLSFGKLSYFGSNFWTTLTKELCLALVFIQKYFLRQTLLSHFELHFERFEQTNIWIGFGDIIVSEMKSILCFVCCYSHFLWHVYDTLELCDLYVFGILFPSMLKLRILIALVSSRCEKVYQQILFKVTLVPNSPHCLVHTMIKKSRHALSKYHF